MILSDNDFFTSTDSPLVYVPSLSTTTSFDTTPEPVMSPLPISSRVLYPTFNRCQK